MPESVVILSSCNHLSITMSTHTPCIPQKDPWNQFFACRMTPVFQSKWSTITTPGFCHKLFLGFGEFRNFHKAL